ncbi:MAG: hypothetical protein Q9227_002995 [Pyrenula ochraceoflavens]
MFFRDRVAEIQTLLASEGCILKQRSASLAVQDDRMDQYLLETLSGVGIFCSLLNGNLQNRTLDLVTFQDMVMSLCYRLLKFRSLNESRQRIDQDSPYHIGLIILMMTIFLKYGNRQIVQYKLIPLCLRDVLKSQLNKCQDAVLLWLMMLGGIWMFGDTDNEWFTSKMRRTIRRLAINSWDEAQRLIAGLPWINVLHDGPSRELWNRVHDGYEVRAQPAQLSKSTMAAAWSPFPK